MGENGRLHLFIPPRIVAIQHEPDRAGAFRFNLEEPVKHSLWIALVVILVALVLAPRGHGPGLCRDCGWVSIAAVGEPPTIMPALVRALAPGGLLMYETFTIGQRERGHPRNPAFLLHPGELLTLIAPLEVVRSREGDFNGRLIASVAARKHMP